MWNNGSPIIGAGRPAAPAPAGVWNNAGPQINLAPRAVAPQPLSYAQQLAARVMNPVGVSPQAAQAWTRQQQAAQPVPMYSSAAAHDGTYGQPNLGNTNGWTYMDDAAAMSKNFARLAQEKAQDFYWGRSQNASEAKLDKYLADFYGGEVAARTPVSRFSVDPGAIDWAKHNSMGSAQYISPEERAQDAYNYGGGARQQAEWQGFTATPLTGSSMGGDYGVIVAGPSGGGGDLPPGIERSNFGTSQGDVYYGAGKGGALTGYAPTAAGGWTSTGRMNSDTVGWNPGGGAVMGGGYTGSKPGEWFPAVARRTYPEDTYTAETGGRVMTPAGPIETYGNGQLTPRFDDRVFAPGMNFDGSMDPGFGSPQFESPGLVPDNDPESGYQWRDPRTGQGYVNDPRTGLPPQLPNMSMGEFPPAAMVMGGNVLDWAYDNVPGMNEAERNLNVLMNGHSVMPQLPPVSLGQFAGQQAQQAALAGLGWAYDNRRELFDSRFAMPANPVTSFGGAYQQMQAMPWFNRSMPLTQTPQAMQMFF